MPPISHNYHKQHLGNSYYRLCFQTQIRVLNNMHPVLCILDLCILSLKQSSPHRELWRAFVSLNLSEVPYDVRTSGPLP